MGGLRSGPEASGSARLVVSPGSSPSTPARRQELSSLLAERLSRLPGALPRSVGAAASGRAQFSGGCRPHGTPARSRPSSVVACAGQSAVTAVFIITPCSSLMGSPWRESSRSCANCRRSIRASRVKREPKVLDRRAPWATRRLRLTRRWRHALGSSRGAPRSLILDLLPGRGGVDRPGCSGARARPPTRRGPPGLRTPRRPEASTNMVRQSRSVDG
jgi:hypothetical protein